MATEFSLHEYMKFKQPGTILTVTGGKGGTGKTNVAVNLAITLASYQLQVALMDADIGLANVEVLLGLKSRHTLQQVIEGTKRVSEIMTVGPNQIKIVPGVSGLNHLANLNKGGQRNVRLAMEELQRSFDYVIIDTMAGIGPASVAFAVAADQVLLVTTPEPSALLDGYATVKMIHGLNPKATVRVVVNMAEDQEQAFRAMNNLACASMKHLSMPLIYAGYIPRDPNVPRAVLQSHPFSLLYPWSPASRNLQNIAALLLNKAPQAQKNKVGFLERFARTLGAAIY